jgi:hypothetical protein
VSQTLDDTALIDVYHNQPLSEDVAAPPNSDTDFDERTRGLPGLPFDVILEVAGFCAGALQFNTFLNLSLCCHEVHHSLKRILGVPILQGNASGTIESVAKCYQVPGTTVREDLLPKAASTIWPKAW